MTEEFNLRAIRVDVELPWTDEEDRNFIITGWNTIQSTSDIKLLYKGEAIGYVDMISGEILTGKAKVNVSIIIPEEQFGKLKELFTIEVFEGDIT